MRFLIAVVLLLVSLTALAAGPPPANVVVAKVFEKEIAETVRVMGMVDFDEKSRLAPEIAGLVIRQQMTEGAVLKKGTVLLRLSPNFIRKDIEIIEQQIRQAGIKIENAARNLKRLKSLYRQKVTSQKDYDDLSDTLRELVVEKRTLQRRLEKKQLELKKTVIRAPFDALILERLKTVGEWVSRDTPVGLLGSVHSTIVRAAVSENLVRFIRPGQEISLVITALDRPLKAHLTAIVPVADPRSKTFQIKIAIPYFDDLIMNMSAAVNVPSSPRMKLRMIKRDALVRFQGKDFVYTVKDGRAKILPVEIAAVNGEYIGVAAPYIVVGMPVVVDGNERLRPDQPVKITGKR